MKIEMPDGSTFGDGEAKDADNKGGAAPHGKPPRTIEQVATELGLATSVVAAFDDARARELKERPSLVAKVTTLTDELRGLLGRKARKAKGTP